MARARLKLVAAIGGVAGIVMLLALLVAALSRIELVKLQRDQARDRLSVEHQAHVQTILNYRKASAAAQAAADQNVARVLAQQTALTRRIDHEYQASLDTADARLRGVRAQLAAQPHLRSADLAPLSITREATCRAYAGTDCDGLLAKLATAERQAWNLIALRAWVEAQAEVPMTVPPAQ